MAHVLLVPMGTVHQNQDLPECLCEETLGRRSFPLVGKLTLHTTEVLRKLRTLR